MSYKTVFLQIMRDYEVRRQQAELLAVQKQSELYEKFPALKQYEHDINVLGTKMALSALKGDQGVTKNIIAQIRMLREQKKHFLNTHGLNENYAEPVYTCMVCRDTGFTQSSIHQASVRCQCLKQNMINEYYALSNLCEVLQNENFDRFNFALFSQNNVPEEGCSVMQNMQRIYNLAAAFTQKFDDEFNNLLFYGETGLGKTFLCHCIAKELLDQGKTVLYLTAPRLCKVIEDSRFNRESMREPDEMLDAVDHVDLLILDDLGTEISTIITLSSIFDIINERILARKHTVISTNLSPQSLEKIYSQRVMSRFQGYYQMIKFFGDDLRIKKKYGTFL